MRIEQITSQTRNDLYGTLKCGHCEGVQKFTGYDDANYHDNVVPQIKCRACGKSGEPV